MTTGLPLDAWALLVVAVGVGLGLQLASWWAHRGERRDGRPRTRPNPRPSRGERRRAGNPGRADEQREDESR